MTYKVTCAGAGEALNGDVRTIGQTQVLLEIARDYAVYQYPRELRRACCLVVGCDGHMTRFFMG